MNIDGNAQHIDKTLSGREIYVVGANRLQNELMTLFLHTNLDVKCYSGENFVDEVERETKTPRMILLDCHEKDEDSLLADLESFDKKVILQDLVVLFNLDASLRIEEEAVMRGVKGFFYVEDPLDRIIKGVKMIFDGELWISRVIMTKFILEDKRSSRVFTRRAKILTAREIDIVALVASGAKNSEIADKLYVSPHTVKCHLYNIFKKLKVSTRLQVALWATKNL